MHNEVKISSIHQNVKDSYFIVDDIEQNNIRVYNKKTGRNLYINQELEVNLIKKDGKPQKFSVNRLCIAAFGHPYYKFNADVLEGEVFKTIEGTNEEYLVSNYGRIASLKGKNTQIMLNYIQNKGYCYIKIKQNGYRRNLSIARLVAKAFVEIPKGYTIDELQIHHKDLNRLNNRSDNLIWLTPKQHHQIHDEIKRQQKQSNTENLHT